MLKNYFTNHFEEEIKVQKQIIGKEKDAELNELDQIENDNKMTKSIMPNLSMMLFLMVV